MDDIKNFKEKVINNYISNLDLNDINPEVIQEDLKNLLQEKPAVRLEYENHTIILEGTEEEKKVEELKSVSVIFTVESIINGKEVPIPIEKTYILS